jgi:RES domain-containing protein
MITAYRIFKTKHASNWIDGEGAFLFGGRWNSRGTRILYCAESLSLATLEMLVHLNSAELLPSYSYATLGFEENDLLPVEKFAKLPKNWSSSPPPVAVQRIGNEWAVSMRSLVLRVPTSIVPGEYNYLINVAHPEFSRLKRSRPLQFNFDGRLHNK